MGLSQSEVFAGTLHGQSIRNHRYWMSAGGDSDWETPYAPIELHEPLLQSLQLGLSNCTHKYVSSARFLLGEGAQLDRLSMSSINCDAA